MPYTDKEGRKGMRVQFHLQGSRNRAVVEVDARENESGTMETRYILVQLEDWRLRKFVVVEDNRKKWPKPKRADNFQQDEDMQRVAVFWKLG